MSFFGLVVSTSQEAMSKFGAAQLQTQFPILQLLTGNNGCIGADMCPQNDSAVIRAQRGTL